ncbi:MAG: CHAP domain-containing protein [Pseudomonadota bacterium]
MARIQRSVGRGGRNIDADVRTVQNLLNRHINALAPMSPFDVNGTCDAVMIEAIVRFQSRVVGIRNTDGRVDPGGRTLRRLSGPPALAPSQMYHYPAGPQAPLADIAVPYIGATEARGNRMGTDPRMREIFEADWLATAGVTDGYPWCCAFVSMCTQKLIQRHPMFYGHLRPPRTASCSGFRTRWAPRNHCLVFPPNHAEHRPSKGDVVLYTFSHIGIVRSVSASSITAIEGNTNEAGSREGTTVRGDKVRDWSVIRCFVRFPVPIQYDTVNQVCRPTVGADLLDDLVTAE